MVEIKLEVPDEQADVMRKMLEQLLSHLSVVPVPSAPSAMKVEEEEFQESAAETTGRKSLWKKVGEKVSKAVEEQKKDETAQQTVRMAIQSTAFEDPFELHETLNSMRRKETNAHLVQVCLLAGYCRAPRALSPPHLCAHHPCPRAARAQKELKHKKKSIIELEQMLAKQQKREKKLRLLTPLCELSLADQYKRIAWTRLTTIIMPDSYFRSVRSTGTDCVSRGGALAASTPLRVASHRDHRLPLRFGTLFSCCSCASRASPCRSNLPLRRTLRRTATLSTRGAWLIC